MNLKALSSRRRALYYDTEVKDSGFFHVLTDIVQSNSVFRRLRIFPVAQAAAEGTHRTATTIVPVGPIAVQKPQNPKQIKCVESIGHALAAFRAFAKSQQVAFQSQSSEDYVTNHRARCIDRPHQLVHTSELPPVDLGQKSIVTRHEGGSRGGLTVYEGGAATTSATVMSCGVLWDLLRV